jgi:transcriptional regulator with XRE-family HTH domain
MDKSLFSAEYELFLRKLRESRLQAGLTQDALALRLKRRQAFVSKFERGERRVDVVELRAFCKAMGISFREFVLDLDDALEQDRKDGDVIA